MYVVFRQSVERCYQTPLCSKASVFYLVASLLTFIPPLLVAYRSNGFWQKMDRYREQPDIHFQHDLVILLETENPQTPLAYSTFEAYNQLLLDNLRLATVKSTELDNNGDGLLDQLHLKIEMPVKSDETINQATIFLFFDVRLKRYSLVHLGGMAHLTASSPFSGSGFSYYGDLNLAQKQPFAHRDDRYKEIPFERESFFAEAYDFATVIQKYQQRNVTVRLENGYSVWKRGVANTGTPFKVEVVINYPEQEVSYYTGFWQMMKWAWIQYFSILIVFIYLFKQIKAFVFSNQIFPVLRIANLE